MLVTAVFLVDLGLSLRRFSGDSVFDGCPLRCVCDALEPQQTPAEIQIVFFTPCFPCASQGHGPEGICRHETSAKGQTGVRRAIGERDVGMKEKLRGK